MQPDHGRDGCPARPIWIYYAIVIPNLFDAMLTTVGIALGVAEVNPLMRDVIQRGGMEALWMVKGIGLLLIITGAEYCRTTFRRAPTFMLVTLSGLSSVVVVHNMILFFRLFG